MFCGVETEQRRLSERHTTHFIACTQRTAWWWWYSGSTEKAKRVMKQHPHADLTNCVSTCWKVVDILWIFLGTFSHIIAESERGNYYTLEDVNSRYGICIPTTMIRLSFRPKHLFGYTLDVSIYTLCCLMSCSIYLFWQICKMQSSFFFDLNERFRNYASLNAKYASFALAGEHRRSKCDTPLNITKIGTIWMDGVCSVLRDISDIAFTCWVEYIFQQHEQHENRLGCD